MNTKFDEQGVMRIDPPEATPGDARHFPRRA